MTESEKKEIIELIDSVSYGEIIIKKEAGKIVLVKPSNTILWRKRSLPKMTDRIYPIK